MQIYENFSWASKFVVIFNVVLVFVDLKKKQFVFFIAFSRTRSGLLNSKVPCFLSSPYIFSIRLLFRLSTVCDKNPDKETRWTFFSRLLFKTIFDNKWLGRHYKAADPISSTNPKSPTLRKTRLRPFDPAGDFHFKRVTISPLKSTSPLPIHTSISRESQA